MPDLQGGSGETSRLVHELRRTLGRLEAALATISDALVITSPEGRLLWCNSAFCELVGEPVRLNLLGAPLQALLPPTAEGTPLLEHQENGPCSRGGQTTVVLRKEPLRALEVEWQPVITERERPLIYCFRDVSSRLSYEELHRKTQGLEQRRLLTETLNQKLQQEQLSLAAKVVECPVTGLPNRRALQARMGAAQAELRHEPGWITLLFCDLNGFKEVNDLFGHQVGDQLIIEVGHRLQDVLRSEDTLARLGGDEFVVMTTDLSTDLEALGMARRLQQALGQPWEVNDQILRPSMSVGIARTDDPSLSIDELLRQADLAMYDAKEKKAGEPISLYTASIDERVRRGILLRGRLQQAIRNEELQLVYQPIVALEDRSVVAVEALVRIPQTGETAMAPEDFIPVAERTGLILPLGRWVIRKAMQELSHRRAGGDRLTLSLNVSPLQLRQEGLADLFLRECQWAAVDPAWTAIEVTESMLIEQPEQATRELHQLREAGVSVYLDDFGTGYSSMSWLSRLPIDALKIDRSFTADFLHHPRRAKVLGGMVRLALDLGLKAMAEGIETEEQRVALLAMGCAWGQGYLFAPPSPRGELTDTAAVQAARQ